MVGDKKRWEPPIRQAHWRIAGAVAIVGSAVMAVVGARWGALRESIWLFFGYWGVFAVLLLSAVYIALLDIRYIHTRFTVDQRDAFKETLGDEDFQKELRGAVAKSRKKKGKNRLN
ncbi:MAG: hypothetical protein JXR94_10785 [Candidatus Hydrogenedentes bacterium]|nr:hypothetical protein [Candidatus Hydrogenedentota bacterium]